MRTASRLLLTLMAAQAVYLVVLVAILFGYAAVIPPGATTGGQAAAWREVLVAAIPAVLGAVLVSALSCMAFARASTRRLRALRDNVARLATTGEYGGTGMRGDDDAGQLAQAIDRLISGREDAFVSMAEAEQRFEDYFENAPDIYLSVAPGTAQILDCNRAFVDAVGLSREEIMGCCVFDFYAPESVDELRRNVFEKFEQHGFAGPFNTVLMTCDGRREVSVNVSAVRDAHGRITRSRTILRDISAEQRLMRELDRNNRHFTDFMDRIPVPFYRNDASGAPIYYNAAARSLVGPDYDDYMGFAWLNLVHEEDREEVERGYVEAMEGRKAWSMEYRLRGPDGEYNWIYDRCEPVYVQGRGFSGFLGVCIDITEQRIAQNHVIATERKFETVFHSHPDAQVIFRPRDGTMLEVNKAFEKMYGYTAEEVAGHSAMQLGMWTDIEERRTAYRLLMAQGYLDNYDRGTRHRDGRRFMVRTSVELFPFGGETLAVITLRDLSEEYETSARIEIYQRRLRDLADELARAEDEERQRMAALIHDDITQMLGWLKMTLEKGSKAPEAGMRTALVDGIRTVSELIETSRNLIFQLNPPVLKELGLRAALEWLAHNLMRDHGIPMSASVDPAVSHLALPLRDTVFRVARELVANTAKHSGATKASLEVRYDAPVLALTVTDDGCGFDPGTADTRSFGLFFVGEMAQRWDGGIEVHSEPGQGARVVVTLLEGLDLRPRQVSGYS